MLHGLGLIFALALGQTPVRVEIARDTWVSGVGSEVDGSNGGAGRLKLKSHQEMSIVDVDPAPLKGKTIVSAQLHVRSAGEPRLMRVTVGGLASAWFEGKASGYAHEEGASTFRHRKSPNEPWTAEGGDICDVLFGPQHKLWGMTDATPPDGEGWQTIAVDPRVIAARVAGISGGFVLFDDTGTEWTRDGEKFDRRHLPNRFVFSRDENRARSPYLTVVFGPDDRLPPEVVTDIRLEYPSDHSGSVDISWTTPRDQGPAGTIGFLVADSEKNLPMVAVPLAGKAGQRVEMRFQGRGEITVRAVDGAGNVGPGAKTNLRHPRQQPLRSLPAPVARPAKGGDLPRIAGVEVAVIDELDKVNPVSGELIPARAKSYRTVNRLWDAGTRTINLIAGRNEFVAFQVVLSGAARGLQVSASIKNAEVELGKYTSVMGKSGPMPDPIVPISGSIDIPSPGETSTSVHVEVYVPHNVWPGKSRGSLTLSVGSEKLELPIDLEILNLTLPDSLSFLPEMNCYGLPENERDFYRLAHRHRTVLNCVPYSQDGRVHPGKAPGWDGKKLDWKKWDQRFGPLLDGSAFADMPRKSVPVDLFYLPLNENWPSPIEGNYNESYWADEAFKANYRRDFVEVSRQIAEHAGSKRWNETLLECFFNGKNDFKLKGWSRGSSPWLLDEPANFQDFWALRYFGLAFHEGVAKAAPSRAKLVFRADISRPQWQRDSLDECLDVNVCGSAFRPYREMVLDRKERLGQVVFEYGGSNPVEESNVQPLAWSIDVWSLGADGVLPWQTVGNDESWTKADELSLFYPGRNGGAPVPSARLKAYRRGQQDVEYLTLYSQVTRTPRDLLASKIREELKLAGERRATDSGGAEDAGRIDYGSLRPENFAALRERVGRAIAATGPAPKNRLVEFRPPRRNSASAPVRLVR